MQKIAKINGEVWVRTSEILQTLRDMSGMPAQDVLQELQRQLILDNSEAGSRGGAVTTVGLA